MTWLDLTIIYLACGSPFAVYHATRREGRRTAADFARVLPAVLAWPIYVAWLIARRLSSDDGQIEARRNEIEEIRATLEGLLFADMATPSSVFAYRDVFYRYAGLTEAARTKESGRTHQLFEIGGHPNKRLASRILAERNRNRLRSHAAEARSELLELLRLSDPEVLHAPALRLAVTLGDELLISGLLDQGPAPLRQARTKGVPASASV